MVQSQTKKGVYLTSQHSKVAITLDWRKSNVVSCCFHTNCSTLFEAESSVRKKDRKFVLFKRIFYFCSPVSSSRFVRPTFPRFPLPLAQLLFDPIYGFLFYSHLPSLPPHFPLFLFFSYLFVIFSFLFHLVLLRVCALACVSVSFH